jgi:hypothetical protein
MSALTNYTENNIINALFRTAAFTKPTALYIGLITAFTDLEAGTVTEVTGGSYTRVARNPLDANWNVTTTDGTTANTSSLQFPAATADWGTCTHFGIWDAATGGNLLIYSALTNARTITNGTTPSFGAGALTFQVDN